MTDSPALRRLVDKLYKKYVSAMDQALLDFVFDDAPTQEKLERCLAACDIEVLGAGKVILLTYAALEHPELHLNAYAGPRTRELNTFFRFANMKTLAHFSRIGKAYNAAGIPMLLFKGGAMKVLRPALSRPLGDVDVLIPAERMAEATRMGEELGYQHTREESSHAVDFHTETESAVDVHHSFFDPVPGRDQTPLIRNIFGRAAPCRAFGVDFLLPCREDLCFLVLNNLTKNLREHTTLHGLWFALCDCRWLLRDRPDFNWVIVRDDAALCGREMETRFAAEFMNRIVPDLIPEPEQHLPAGTAVDDFCGQVVYDEDYFFPHRRRCQELRVVELKNAPRRWVPYLAKYLVMEKLRGNPAFVRWFLRRKERMEATRVL